MPQNRVMLTCAIVGWLSTSTFAAPIDPSSYDMINGQVGAFSYLDGTYAPSDSNTTPLASLTGGKGELTDGFTPETAWQDTPGPYVGWLTVDPALRFHFEQSAIVDSVTVFLSDTGGSGGVNAPTEVTVSSGSNSVTQPISNASEATVFSVTVDNLSWTGTEFDVSLLRGEGWLMVSEVQFDGRFVPEPSSGLMSSLLALGLLVVKRRLR